MQDLPDSPVARKRRKLAARYFENHRLAHMHGDDLYFPDGLCMKCGTWATYRVSDKKCCGCNGGGPFAGDRAKKRKPRTDHTMRGYYFGRGFKPADHEEYLMTPVKVCDACGVTCSSDWAADHIFPHAAGGPSEKWNMQLLCKTCNTAKTDKLPNEWFALIGAEMPADFVDGFSKFHKEFAGVDWSPGDHVDLAALPRRDLTKKSLGRKNMRQVSPAGKWILTPKKARP